MKTLAFAILFCVLTTTEPERPDPAVASPKRSQPKLPTADDSEAFQAWKRLVESEPQVTVEFRRIQYDFVFKTEKHATGRFVWNGEDEWLFEVRPAEFEPDAEAGRAREGFTLAKDRAETWAVTEGTLHILSPGTRTWNRYEMKKGKWNAFWPVTPDSIRTCVALPSRELLSDSWWFLKSDREESAHWFGVPKRREAATGGRRLELIWNMPDSRPAAIRIEGPAGNSEIVLTFQEWTVREESTPIELPDEDGYTIFGPKK